MYVELAHAQKNNLFFAVYVRVLGMIVLNGALGQIF